MQPFSKEKPTTVSVDASLRAIGAVLSQEGHPVLYISRKLSDTEARYSNIEREALAALWACQRLEHFLLGKAFTILTDHKPLVYIFYPDSAVKTDISARLVRFSLKMMRYDYVIKHVKGKNNIIADGLSRVFCQESSSTPQVHFSETCIDSATLAHETEGDRFLQDLKRRVISGNWASVSKKERPFKRYAFEMTIDDNGCVRLGSRIGPPQSF